MDESTSKTLTRAIAGWQVSALTRRTAHLTVAGDNCSRTRELNDTEKGTKVENLENAHAISGFRCTVLKGIIKRLKKGNIFFFVNLVPN